MQKLWVFFILVLLFSIQSVADMKSDDQRKINIFIRVKNLYLSLIITFHIRHTLDRKQ